ncbi:phage tail tape measure protein [Adhaeribacter aquaticus]|uniref:phage tail tape measure protein n=1 Tax=Adhaeribacter aquaticus TaxID=299567 RepID=UPI00042A65B6|nr:phage tail tape measure protein [Adhaeribacter aquaticus]
MPQKPGEVLVLHVDTQQYQKEIEEATKKLVALRNSQKILDQTFKEGGVSADDYAKRTRQIKTESTQLTQQQNAQIKILNHYTSATKHAAGSVDQLKDQSAILTKQYNSLTREQRDNTKEGKALAAQLKAVNNELKESGAAVGDHRRNVGNYFDSLKSFFSGNGGIGGAISSIASFIPGLGGIIGQAVGGITEGFEDTTKSVIQLRGEIQQTMGIVGLELEVVTAKAQTLVEVFDADFNETILAANALTKQFGIDAVDSLDLIRDGYLAGANASGEFLDSVKEYSTQFQAAGGSAEEFIAILATTNKAGLFSDKGIDAIKEGMLRLREQTKATVEALEPLGKTANKAIRDAIDDNRIFDAIKLVSKGLNETSLTAAETGTIIADVFGGAGEDAGLKYLQGLQNINTELEGQIDLSNELVKRQKESVEATEQYNLAFNTLSATFQSTTTSSGVFFTNIKTQGLMLLNGLVLIFRALAEMGTGAVKILNAVFNPFSKDRDAKLMEGAKQMYNSISKVRREYEQDQKQLEEKARIDQEKRILEAERKFAQSRDNDSKKSSGEAAKKRAEVIKEALELQKMELETKLNLIKRGSEEELKLKEELIKKQVQIENTAIGLSIKRRKANEAKANSEIEKLRVDFHAQQLENNKKLSKKELETALLATKEIYNRLEIEQKEYLFQGVFNEEQYNANLAALKEGRLEGEIALLKEYGEKAGLTNEEIANKEMELANLVADNKISSLKRTTEADKKEREKQVEAALKQAKATEYFIDGVNAAFANALTEQGLNLQEFSKGVLMVVLDTLEKSVTARTIEATFGVTVGSLSSPESITTLGVAGIAKAAIMAGLIKAAFAAAKGSLAGALSSDSPKVFRQGGIIDGPSHENGGVKYQSVNGVIELEGGESVINRNSTAKYRDLLSAINVAGGGKPLTVGQFMKAGGITSTPAPVIMPKSNMPSANEIAKALAKEISNMPAPVTRWVDFKSLDNKMTRKQSRTDI